MTAEKKIRFDTMTRGMTKVHYKNYVAVFTGYCWRLYKDCELLTKFNAESKEQVKEYINNIEK